MTSAVRVLTRRVRAALQGPDAVRRADLRAAQKAYVAPAPVPARPELRAAVAAEPRIAAGLAWEWSQRELTSENWPSVLVAGSVDLVLLHAPSGELSGWDDALARCAELELPVFAWVTGDAGVARPWAARVDRVFVDDERLLPGWPGAGLLAPAVQPRLHNPQVSGPRQVAAAVLGPTVAGVDEGRQDPLSQALAGPAVSGYPVVVQSGEPAPWLVLPAVASGSCLVDSAPDDELKAQVTARIWQPELAAREGLVQGREARARQSYARRVETLAQAAGLPVPPPDRTVSAIVPTNREHELDNVFANVGRQRHDGVQLVLVLHGLDAAALDVRARAKEAGIDAVTVVEADSSLPLGACMNLGLDAADGAVVAKMDDDNFYGEHYLGDLVDAFGYTDAGIVGKWAHYVWLRSTGAVVLRSARSENRYERLVQGGSMVLKGDVARALRFDDSLPRGVDTDILDRAKRDGVLTYSADRFNYVSVRGTDRTAHTWTITDAALMNRAGQLAFFGDPREHVSV